MPRISKLNLKPLHQPGNETIGQRITRFRKERGYTQQELAKKIGIIQALVSDYEKDKIRLYDEMLARFALALEVTSDEILGINLSKKRSKQPSLKIMKRLAIIDELSPSQQKKVLQSIDLVLQGAIKEKDS